MKVRVECRLPDAGFVYAGDARMIFAPGYAVREGVFPPTALVLRQGNWGWVGPAKQAVCLSALKKRFPTKQIILAAEINS